MNQLFFDTAEKVYKALSDEQSRKIYCGMVMFNLTKDEKYVSYDFKEILKWNGVDLLNTVQKHAQQPIVLFGAGKFGKETLEMYPEIKWRCCVDNYQTGFLSNNLKIISVKELKEVYPDAYIVIAVKKHTSEIFSQLIRDGFDANNILKFSEVIDTMINTFRARQYFDLQELTHDENEVFVDAGGLDGETSSNFSKWANGKYKHIYVFEANPKLSEEIKNNLQNLNNCTVCGKGLWNEAGRLSFRESPYDEEFNVNLLEHNCFDKEHEKLEDWTEHNIDVVRMDDIIPNERVTFIKMDIEGSEANALRGAEGIIRKYRPKLAICVYHRQDDLWVIPSLLLDFHPDYKLYLRTYSLGWGETVLYAI